MIVVGYLNVDPKNTGGQGQDEEIATAVAPVGLEYLVGNFLLKRWACCKDWRTWAVVRQGRIVWS